MPKYHDLLPEELDEQNQALLEEMRYVCQPTPQAIRSFAHIRERLLAADEVPEGSNNLLSTETRWEKRADASRTNDVVSQRRNRGRLSRTLSLVAATLAVVLVVGLLVTTLAMTRGTRSAAVASQTNHPAATLEDVHMVDNQTGWATGSNGTVLRTTDGGLHWQDVTPPAVLILAFKIKVMWQEGTYDAFSGASTAWITLTPNGDNSWDFKPANISLIFHTTNGGQTWQETTLQTDGTITEQINFINARDGWLLTSTEVATHVVTGPEHRLPSDLYVTKDGGKTWTKILDMHSAQDAIFQDIVIDGMSFSPDGQNGLITGGSTFTGEAVAYMTHNGGFTWQKLTVTSPAPHTSINSLIKPDFLTNEDAYFTANIVSANNKTVGVSILRTSDGGVTWAASPVLPTPPAQSDPDGNMPRSAGVSFIDRNHGWTMVLTGTGANILYATRDGGQTWENTHKWGSDNTTTNATQQATSFLPVSGFDFTSTNNGWVLISVRVMKATDKGVSSTTTVALYRTIDGGHTWTSAPVHFPSFISI